MKHCSTLNAVRNIYVSSPVVRSRNLLLVISEENLCKSPLTSTSLIFIKRRHFGFFPKGLTSKGFQAQHMVSTFWKYHFNLIGSLKRRNISNQYQK